MKRGTVSENVRAFGDFGKVGKAVTILMGLGGGVSRGSSATGTLLDGQYVRGEADESRSG